MKRTSIALAVLVLAACAPQASGPEAAVSAVYKPLAESKGQTGTDIASIPFTADMAEQIKAVEAKADGAMFDFDIAGNCQDCTGFSDLKVATPLGPAHVSEDGHYFIEATFKFESGQRSSVIWDMVEVNGAWKVDNIYSNDFDLRQVADDQLLARVVGPEAENGIVCLTVLRLHADAVLKYTPPGDVAAFEAANAAHLAEAQKSWKLEELAQFAAINVDVYGKNSPEDIAAEADACLKSAPAAAASVPAPP